MFYVFRLDMRVTKSYVLSFLDLFPAWEKGKVMRKYIQEGLFSQQKIEAYARCIQLFKQSTYEKMRVEHLRACKDDEVLEQGSADLELEKSLLSL